MGSPDSDDMADDNERPQHQVKITTPFQLGVYPVTQDEYEKVVGGNPSCYKGDGRRPVENVSWFDAINFCNKLSKRESIELTHPISKQIAQVLRIHLLSYRG